MCIRDRAECVAYGADTYLVEGLISDAGKVIKEACKKHGWFEVATLKEPYRIEGKKTMGLEIWQDYGEDLPDAIIYPTGGGVGLIGMWKAFKELKELGWLKGPLPKMVAVQAEGCSPIVTAYREGKNKAEFHKGAHTLAAGIRVPSALGDFLVLDACLLYTSVVLRYPLDPSKDYIKRVVALAGDTVELRLGRVYVNGQLKEEPYIHFPGLYNMATLTVPEGTVFVMGDHRVNSEDSRFFGPVKQELVKGKAIVIIWPLKAAGAIK